MMNIGAAMCLANAVRMSQENVRRAGDGEVPMPLDWDDAFDWWYE